MANLKDILTRINEADPIEAVVIGHFADSEYQQEYMADYLPQGQTAAIGKILSWKEAAPLLDYDYSDGYGSVNCNAIHAWTQNYVHFIGCYDGSSWVDSVPRNPTDDMPSTVGGG